LHVTSDNEKTRDEADTEQDAPESTDEATSTESNDADDTSAEAPNADSADSDDAPDEAVDEDDAEAGDAEADEPEEQAYDPTEAMNAEAIILSERLGPVGVFDRWVYNLEVVIVVTFLVLMSITVFTDVMYQLMVSIDQWLDKGDSAAYSTIAGVLGFIALMAFAATGSNAVHDPDADEDEQAEADEAKPLGVRIGVVFGTVAVSTAVGYALLALESTTVYRLILVAIVAPVVFKLWTGGNPKAAGILGVSSAVAFYLFGSLPQGYSWAQSYSLLMLLWVGFLGASIAARERRHLRVDLARKLLPPDKLPAFNAVSYTVAAIFTGVVLYLGYIYMFGADSTYLRPIWDAPGWLPEATRQTLMTEFPLPDDASFGRRFMQVIFAPSEPGEVPDWLKVMAIPFSMALVAIRFLGHAFVFARMAMRGESFNETAGAH
jgi:C4-dicarboxylate transporter DctQ subunit